MSVATVNQIVTEPEPEPEPTLKTQNQEQKECESETETKTENYIDEEQLLMLKRKIEKVDKHYHKNFFRIFKDNNVRYSSNVNGIFINISFINQETFDSAIKLIDYIEQQERILNDVEQEKEKMLNVMNE
jgi:hypothetical protein